MDFKKIIFPAFILLVLVQLFVPANMIIEQEAILKKGTAYKFKTAPIDPYDPFRGKYVWLSYEDNWVEIDTADGWNYFDKVYVEIENDMDGFAKIKSVSRFPLSGNTSDYIETTISLIQTYEEPAKLYVDYPFDRFYMDEFKAQPAEDLVREASIDTSVISYALVKIKNGQAVIENVYIDDVPLKEFVEQQQD